MKRMIGLWLTLALLVPFAYAQQAEEKTTSQPADPVEILKKTDAACKALKTVTYEVSLEGTGEFKARAGRVQAKVIAARLNAKADALGLGQKFVVDARLTLPGASEPQHLTIGSDGEKFYVVRHDAKKVHEDVDPAVLGQSGRGVLGAMMFEYLHPAPYDDELKGKKRELLGSKVIEGVDCYEIHVVYASEAQAATWYVSKKDYVPMRRIDEIALPDGKKGTVEKTVSKLEIDPKLDENAFKLKVPEGYTKTDEPAP
jgi:outer membrane lipoprotein-sorting protein